MRTSPSVSRFRPYLAEYEGLLTAPQYNLLETTLVKADQYQTALKNMDKNPIIKEYNEAKLRFREYARAMLISIPEKERLKTLQGKVAEFLGNAKGTSKEIMKIIEGLQDNVKRQNRKMGEEQLDPMGLRKAGKAPNIANLKRLEEIRTEISRKSQPELEELFKESILAFFAKYNAIAKDPAAKKLWGEFKRTRTWNEATRKKSDEIADPKEIALIAGLCEFIKNSTVEKDGYDDDRQDRLKVIIRIIRKERGIDNVVSQLCEKTGIDHHCVLNQIYGKLVYEKPGT